jgi:AcrR family transcriptional regulator
MRNSTDEELAPQAARRSGRRPGESGTRASIEASARRLFAERGYERTSVRAVAAAAAVDPALVTHYFGSKQRLFISVVAPPVPPELVVEQIVSGPPEAAGERLARFVLGVLEEPESRARAVAIVRAAASDADAAAMLRELITRELYGPIAAALGGDRPELRANLLGSQIVGLVMARYVVAVEPLASASADELAQALAPTLQRYLLGDL